MCLRNGVAFFCSYTSSKTGVIDSSHQVALLFLRQFTAQGREREKEIVVESVVMLRKKFNVSLMRLIKKSDNSNLFSKEKYAQVIKEGKEPRRKKRRQCWLSEVKEISRDNCVVMKNLLLRLKDIHIAVYSITCILTIFLCITQYSPQHSTWWSGKN